MTGNIFFFPSSPMIKHTFFTELSKLLSDGQCNLLEFTFTLKVKVRRKLKEKKKKENKHCSDKQDHWGMLVFKG